MTTYWGLNVYASMVVSLCLLLLIGFINGFLVTRTGLPSFIITLGMFLALQGINLGRDQAGHQYGAGQQPRPGTGLPRVEGHLR